MSSLALIFTVCQGLIPILVIVALITLLAKKSYFSIKPFGVGVLVFVVFSQVLESILHAVILMGDHATSTFLANHPFAYATYGALAAGIFEEVGRYVGFRVLLKRFRDWKDGISYGLGHGGIEAFLIGTVGAIEAIIFGVLANAGKLPATMPAAAKTQILAMVHQPAYTFALGTFERLVALSLQLALSLIILYGIRKRNILYLGLAILLHAITDFTPALYQKHAVNLVTVELVMLVIGVVAITFIIRSNRLFDKIKSTN